MGMAGTEYIYSRKQTSEPLFFALYSASLARMWFTNQEDNE